jgi:hypothetical protein
VKEAVHMKLNPRAAMPALLFGCTVALAGCDRRAEPTAATPAGPSLAQGSMQADSAELKRRARERSSGIGIMSTGSWASIPIQEGQKATVTVSYVRTARCEIVSVSGAINQTVFPEGVGGCGRGGIESDGMGATTTIGPSPSTGSLTFRISSPGSSVVSGGNGVYTVSMGDELGDDMDDVVLTVKIEGGKAELKCDPSPVERGQTVRCTLTVPLAFKVLSQRATGKGFAPIEETPDQSYPAGASHTWEGPAVADSKIQMGVETTENGATKQRTYTAEINVKERTWPTWQVSSINTQVTMIPEFSPYPGVGDLLGGARLVVNSFNWSQLPVARPAQGPNKGVAYLRDPFPPFDYEIFLHPALDPVPAGLKPGQPGYQPWHRWRDDQNGQGSGTCREADMLRLRVLVERHEGVTRAPDSHVGKALDFWTKDRPQQRIERLYTDKPDHELLKRVFDTWERYIEGPFRSQQKAFDQTDYPKIYAALGCTLDLNPNDR